VMTRAIAVIHVDKREGVMTLQQFIQAGSAHAMTNLATIEAKTIATIDTIRMTKAESA